MQIVVLLCQALAPVWPCPASHFSPATTGRADRTKGCWQNFPFISDRGETHLVNLVVNSGVSQMLVFNEEVHNYVWNSTSCIISTIYIYKLIYIYTCIHVYVQDSEAGRSLFLHLLSQSAWTDKSYPNIHCTGCAGELSRWELAPTSTFQSHPITFLDIPLTPEIFLWVFLRYLVVIGLPRPNHPGTSENVRW